MGGWAEGLRTYVCESNSELLDTQGMPGDKGDKGDAGLPGPQVLFFAVSLLPRTEAFSLIHQL